MYVCVCVICVCVISMCVCDMCVCVCDIFIHSYVEERLGCFSILAIVNKASMNIGCMYLFELIFSLYLDINLGVELLDHMVVLSLGF